MNATFSAVSALCQQAIEEGGRQKKVGGNRRAKKRPLSQKPKKLGILKKSGLEVGMLRKTDFPKMGTLKQKNTEY